MCARAAELIKALRSTDGTTDVSVIFRRIRQAADEIETLCAEVERLRLSLEILMADYPRRD
jgi:hypothetical protein